MPKIDAKNKKIAVGLSGGVDSAIAAHLLKQKGYDVTGVFMQCWDARADGCKADVDRADAVKVAAHLGIDFVALNFTKEYSEKVISTFYQEYEKGRTPNPDILCNKEIKFGLFLDWALKKGYDKVATGHYARVKQNDIDYKLFTGIDSTKDQSYFLYLLTGDILSKVIFPLGEMTKKEVRQLASELGLHNHAKPDSVGICFIGEVNIKDFLKQKIQGNSGNVITKNGEIIGTHDGAAYYTIGQRHGFTTTKYVGLPLYVIGKNMIKNELIVGYAQDVAKAEFFVADLHWINQEPVFPIKCSVRTRHLGEFYDCVLEINNDTLHVNTSNSIFGVAPGQSAVFYNGNEVLGGGIIL